MDTTTTDVAAAAAKPDQPANNPWPERLAAWKTFSERFHERGGKIEIRYEDERDANQMTAGTNATDIGGKRVNMFYSNVSVVKESLFNSLPKPDVSRLHKGEWDNDEARVAATIVERGLTYEINCAPSFDEAVKHAVLDRLVPGLGTLWVNFNGPKQLPNGKIRPEHITVDIVYWKDLIFEPQRAWPNVTWVGRKLHVAQDVAKQRWGDTALEVPEKSPAAASTAEQAMSAGKVCVIQMWDKNTGTVIHMTPTGTVLKTDNDPYQLKDFFPTPKPLIASPPTRKFLPLPDYYMAQDQYLELDTLYARINLIIEAIRVAGVYDSSVSAIGRMLSGTENKLIPVDNWAMFADKGGTKGVIDWFPVQEVAAVLTNLVSAFEFIKKQLFEVTGMADIVRGSTNQYETAAAQTIKAQFASVRMNGYQRDVAEFVRDSVRIIAELMCQLYSDEKLSMVCGKLPQEDQPHVPGALQILRDDYLLHYNVDIESDSLTQADWGLEQQQRMNYIQALGGFLSSAVPAAEQQPGLRPLLVQMIKFASVGFKGSNELEGVLDNVLDQLSQMPAQDEDKPDPEQIKAQAEVEALQAKIAAERESAQLKQQMQQAEFEHKQRMNAADLQFKRVSHAMDLQHQQETFTAKTQEEAVKGAQQIAIAGAKADQKREAEPAKE